MNAGGVRQPQQYSAAEDGFLHCVPGGARDVGDNRPVAACQGIEQGALSRIGAANNGGAHAGFQNPAPPTAVQQAVQGGASALKGGGDLLGVNVLDVLVRIVHHRVKPGGDLQQGFLDGFQHPAETALQLGGGVAGRGSGLGVNQVDDGLRLRQVQPPV